MGCHTWFYTKSKTITKEDVYNKAKLNLEYYISMNKQFIERKDHSFIRDKEFFMSVYNRLNQILRGEIEVDDFEEDILSMHESMTRFDIYFIEYVYNTRVDATFDVSQEELNYRFDEMYELIKTEYARYAEAYETGVIPNELLSDLYGMQVEDDYTRESYIIFNGEYYEDAGAHDIIRVYGYPEDIITSYDMFMEYIKDNPNVEKDIQQHQYDAMKKFWDENPDSIIEFG